MRGLFANFSVWFVSNFSGCLALLGRGELASMIFKLQA